MHTLIQGGHGGLMAQWRASGGTGKSSFAGGAPATPGEGLAAHQPTSRAGGCPPFGDDGLKACVTAAGRPGCEVDDGLLAGLPGPIQGCGADEGLAASRVTSPAGGCPPFAEEGPPGL